MHRNKLLTLISSYSPIEKEELAMKQKLVEFVTSTPRCFDNKNASGHITASAWIVDLKNKKVGLVQPVANSSIVLTSQLNA